MSKNKNDLDWLKKLKTKEVKIIRISSKELKKVTDRMDPNRLNKH